MQRLAASALATGFARRFINPSLKEWTGVGIALEQSAHGNATIGPDVLWLLVEEASEEQPRASLAQMLPSEQAAQPVAANRAAQPGLAAKGSSLAMVPAHCISAETEVDQGPAKKRRKRTTNAEFDAFLASEVSWHRIAGARLNIFRKQLFDTRAISTPQTLELLFAINRLKQYVPGTSPSVTKARFHCYLICFGHSALHTRSRCSGTVRSSQAKAWLPAHWPKHMGCNRSWPLSLSTQTVFLPTIVCSSTSVFGCL